MSDNIIQLNEDLIKHDLRSIVSNIFRKINFSHLVAGS